MRIRTTLLAASIAVLPALAFAQTQTQPAPSESSPPAAASPSAPAVKGHHDHAKWRQHRAELHQRYEKLSAADKAKFDGLRKQIRELHKQQMELLGIGKS